MEYGAEAVRAGFALAVLVLGGLIRFYGKRIIEAVDEVRHAATEVLPARLDASDRWRETCDVKLATIDQRLTAGDIRMGSIETTISEHTTVEEQNTVRAIDAVNSLADAIRAGEPVGRAAE